MSKATTLVLLLAFSLLIACKMDNKMTQLDNLVTNVKDSTTVDAERSALLEIADFIQKNNISIDTHVIVSGDKLTIQNATNLTDTESVELTFYANDNSSSFSWKPKSIDNIFVLYRE